MIHQTRKVANAFASASLFRGPISKNKISYFQNVPRNQIRSLEDHIVCGKMRPHQASSYLILD